MKNTLAAVIPIDFKKEARNAFVLIADEMQLVEKELARQLSSQIQIVDFLGEYIRSAGGKRIRPALLMLSNRSLGGDASSENVIRMAAVMEMLHTATLVHDDIIDNAEVRRNRPSVNAKFGNQTAVLMGDWLYMSAFEASLGERSLRILDILTRLTRLMTEGELLQLTTVGKIDVTENQYFDILRRKTAYLFSACCEVGAILAGASDEQVKALAEYGLNLGIAFQLADDLLDFTSDDSILGKRAGADLVEGKLTLPLILLRNADPDVADQLEIVMLDKSYSGISREKLVNALKRSNSLEMARQRAYQHAESAIKNLEVLPQTEYRLALGDLPAFVIERNR
ncbi:MAG TPA: polyprenyl synthetase family protein [Pyrinomonadaceae bacterium]|nr:polyprenyl synthetase family protein [Pyrinomonadaceae bacterium]